MHDPGPKNAACEWCGRAIAHDDRGWYAVKGEERGYDPPVCEGETGRHEPADVALIDEAIPNAT